MPCKGIALPTELTARSGDAHFNDLKAEVNLFLTDSFIFPEKAIFWLNNKHLQWVIDSVLQFFPVDHNSWYTHASVFVMRSFAKLGFTPSL